MPVQPTYPGVYVEEIPSGVRTIIGVSTSTTAFLGRALRGDSKNPVLIHSFADYERTFGGLWIDSTMSYAVQHYFLNGGLDAIIVRLVNGATKAQFSLTGSIGSETLHLEADSEGLWGNNLQISVNYLTRDITDKKLFNLIIQEIDPSTISPLNPKGLARSTESFLNVTVKTDDPRYVGRVLKEESSLVQVLVQDPPIFPFPTVGPADTTTTGPVTPSTPGSDGAALTPTQYLGDRDEKTGIYALAKTDIFNLLVIPPATREIDIDQSVWVAASEYCVEMRAFLIMDTPIGWKNPKSVISGIDDKRNGYTEYEAIYFPHLMMPDPLLDNRLEEFAPCGVVAGIYARTDAQRGIWKAPAGIDATLIGVQALTV